MKRRVGHQFWRLVFTDLPEEGTDGMCQHPGSRDKRILLDRSLKKSNKDLLETILHEGLHAACWSLDEEYVERYAADMARILSEIGVKIDDDGLDKIPFMPYNSAMGNIPKKHWGAVE
jgi:hypothetical protein